MTTKPDLNHLTKKTASVALQSTEVRLAYLKQYKWIGYPRANEIKETLEELLDEPKHTRMPCLAVIGPSDNGKSMLIKNFLKKHPIDPNPEGEHILAPVLVINAPSKPDPVTLLHYHLEAINAPFKPNAHPSVKEGQIEKLYRDIGVKMVILDEFHEAQRGTPAKRLEYLGELKHLHNRLDIVYVAFGTHRVLGFLRESVEVHNRFETVRLDPWKDEEEFRKLLGRFEAVLPLLKPSRLYEDECAHLILLQSKGILGEIDKLLRAAAKEAILNGQEQITVPQLKKLGHTPALLKRDIEYKEAYAKNREIMARSS